MCDVCQKKNQNQEEQERLAHEIQLEEDKKELLKLKQGVIEQSDTIFEQHEPEKQYTLKQRKIFKFHIS